MKGGGVGCIVEKGDLRFQFFGSPLGTAVRRKQDNRIFLLQDGTPGTEKCT